MLRTSFSSLLILQTRTTDRIVFDTMNFRSYRICNTLDAALFRFPSLVEWKKREETRRKGNKLLDGIFASIIHVARYLQRLLPPQLLYANSTLTFARDTSDLSSSMTLLLFGDLTINGSVLSTTQTSRFFVDTSPSKFYLDYRRRIVATR